MVAPVAIRHRLTIRSIDPDPRAAAIVAGAEHLGLDLDEDVAVADIVFIEGELEPDELNQLHAVLVDPLLQQGSWDTPPRDGVEVTLHAGVTDSGAEAVRHAAEQLSLTIDSAATGRRIEFPEKTDPVLAEEVIARLVANPIIEHWATGTIEPAPIADGVEAKSTEVIEIRGLDDAALQLINEDRALYLDPEELRIIRDHYDELGRDITDVEIETLAQTWSEHCSHKTFRAIVDATGGPEGGERVVEPLFEQLRCCTESIDAPFVISAFVGNAGVIEFTKGTTIALKAETHNHPSAVEPFGGANTGVGGVILASRLRSVATNTGGGNLLLNVIAAAVIGGTSLFGGSGRVVSALYGALVITSIQNGMDLLGLNSGIKFIVTGIVLLLAVMIDSVSKRRRAARGLT